MDSNSIPTELKKWIWNFRTKNLICDRKWLGKAVKMRSDDSEIFDKKWSRFHATLTCWDDHGNLIRYTGMIMMSFPSGIELELLFSMNLSDFWLHEQYKPQSALTFRIVDSIFIKAFIIIGSHFHGYSSQFTIIIRGVRSS